MGRSLRGGLRRGGEGKKCNLVGGGLRRKRWKDVAIGMEWIVLDSRFHWWFSGVSRRF